ncbi:MAG: adenosylcobinamide-phosphate synthase CbiB [Proteocatella sp.]
MTKEMIAQLDAIRILSIPGSLVLAYMIDGILGDPYNFPHPVKYIGKLIRLIEGIIRKTCHTSKTKKLGGLFLFIITTFTSAAIVYLLVELSFKFNFYVGFVVQSIVMYTCLAKKCLYDEGIKVYECIKSGDIEKSRIQISYLVGRDTTNLSFDEIIRATVETVAENTVDGIIAPMFYGIIGGAPLMMFYKAVNTLDSMVGYKNEKYGDIGFFSAKIDDIFNFIPARISIIGFMFAALVKGQNQSDCVKIAIRDRKNHKSPNCAYPEGAVAGALGVQLGGTNVYFGEVVEKPTIGDKLRPLQAEDIVLSGQLMKYCSFFMLFIFIVIWLLII